MKGFKIIAITITPIIIVIGIGAAMLKTFPFSYSDIDLNNNGLIGFSEADYVLNYGIKEKVINNQQCQEYYALKDGMAIKVTCGD